MNPQTFFRRFKDIEKKNKKLKTYAAIEDGIENIARHKCVSDEKFCGVQFLMNHTERKAIMLLCVI